MGIGQLCAPQTGSITEIECTLSGHPYNEGVTPQKLDTCTTFLVLPKATPIVGWLQNDYCQAHVAANGFCCLYLLFSVSVPAPSSFTKMLDPCTHNVLYVFVYSLLFNGWAQKACVLYNGWAQRRHAYCTMAGHRRHAYCTMAGHREGMRTVQWLGTEKACVLYNGWAQKACVLYNGWAQRRHAYCTMAGHRRHAYCTMAGHRRHAYCTMASLLSMYLV